jgi:hypothetical protein
MRNLFLLMMITISVFLQSCYGDDKDDPATGGAPGTRLISTRIFSFTADVDPATLTEGVTVNLTSSGMLRPEKLIISTPAELTTFIQMTDTIQSEAYYQEMFNNLDTQTYLLIRGPSCPDYYEYAGYQSNPPSVLIIMNHFLHENVVCTADMSDTYYVLKGAKSAGL